MFQQLLGPPAPAAQNLGVGLRRPCLTRGAAALPQQEKSDTAVIQQGIVNITGFIWTVVR
jgi:hypothetical protein